MRWLVLKLICFYRRYISIALLPRCRYLPTCSEYAFDAIGEYGLIQGGVMALKRICRCHPFRTGGFDPLPPKSK